MFERSDQCMAIYLGHARLWCVSMSYVWSCVWMVDDEYEELMLRQQVVVM